MSTKKKFTISLLVAVAVLLISVVAIVAISAAVNQNISSNIKVKYKSNQVKAEVFATYKFGNSVNYMTTDGKDANQDNTSVDFKYKEEPTTKYLQLQKRDLKNGALDVGEDVGEIIFTFTFKNTGTDGFTAFFSIDEESSKLENVLVTFSKDNETWSTENTSVHVPKPSNVSHEPIVQCFIKISMVNAGLEASFDGVFTWDLIADDPYLS